MTAFIIDTYNRFDQFDKDHSRYIFEINEIQYAIKEVHLKWGRPQLPLRIGADREDEPYKIYDTFDEAFEFTTQMRNLNK